MFCILAFFAPRSFHPSFAPPPQAVLHRPRDSPGILELNKTTEAHGTIEPHDIVDRASIRLPVQRPSIPAAAPVIKHIIMAGPRRRKAVIGQRRRVEDEAEDEGGPDGLDLEDDSLTEGSVTDEGERADDSDTSNIDEASPTSPRAAARKAGNGAAKGSAGKKGSDMKLQSKPVSETDIMLNGMGPADEVAMPVQEMNFDEVALEPASRNGREPSVGGPIVVSSGSASRSQTGNETVHDRRRREHDEYRRQRDENPSFVPNRGAFFMHDHRHAGPAANGFRPFNALRGGGRGQLNGGGRGGFTQFAPTQ